MKNIKLLSCKSLLIIFSITLLNCTKISPKIKDKLKIGAKNAGEDVLVTRCKKQLAECKDELKIRQLKLELADIYFQLDQMQKAANAYKDFIKLNPVNLQDKCKDDLYKKELEDYEYSTYRLVMSLYNDTLAPDRDQSKTKEALEFCKEYLQQFVTNEFKESLKNKSFTNLLHQVEKHETAIKKVASMSQRKLLDSEIDVFYFYLRNRSFISAKKRLDYIKDKFFKNAENDEILKSLEDHFEKARARQKYTPLNSKEISKLYVVYNFFDYYSPTNRKKRKFEQTGTTTSTVTLKPKKRKNKDRF